LSAPQLFGDTLPDGHKGDKRLNDPRYTLTKEFGPLQDARKEINDIKTLVGHNAQDYIGNTATESAVKAVISPRILHIAAHGYNITPRSGNVSSFEMGPSTFGSALWSALHFRTANPLLHSYIAMAEYSTLQSLESEDGILTDIEVMSLRLRGTNLAVASGCSTGMGVVSEDEGIYNMRRAFALAGAKAQVVTLWDVPDFGTSRFMVEFYSRLLGGRKTIDAFIETQRFFVQNEYSKSPQFWAAFTISGRNVLVFPTNRSEK
jgi:CHAT domain-containing protein